MKVIFYLLFLFSAFSAIAQPNQLDHIIQAEQKEYLSMKQEPKSGAYQNCNVIYDRLQVSVDPAVNFISGCVTTVFIAKSAMPFIEFDLIDTLIVDSVVYHTTALTSIHAGDVVHVDFPTPVNNGQTDSISIYYHGSPSGSGFGSFVHSTHGPDSIPVIWTLSEPYGARDWWPCRQNLSDKIDSIDIFITAPSAYKSASNGLLVEETVNGPNTTHHWKHRYPIATYLVCLAVTNYVQFYNYAYFNGDTLPILNLIYPEDSAAWRSDLDLTPRFLHLYDSLFGGYAFQREKYGQAEFGWGGGMEHQTMTFVGGHSFDLYSHELGHHWFGDKITCGSWQDIWLNEGFATYLTTLCYEFIGQNYFYASKQSNLFRASRVPGGSVFCDDTTSVPRIFDGSLSYGKGAMVLHMIRWVIGDSCFFGALRSYIADSSLIYSFAFTDNLRHHFEATSGRDLATFFDKWVYKKGNPSYQVDWKQDDNNRVTITLGQTQTDPSVAFFDMPVPVKLSNAYTDTTLVLNNTVAGQTFTIDLPFAADTLIFDPELWLLSSNNTVTHSAANNFSAFVYPNPAASTMQLNIQYAEAHQAEVRIFNGEGQICTRFNYNLQQGFNHLPVDVSTLADGTYNLSVWANGKTTSTKFVVSHGHGK